MNGESLARWIEKAEHDAQSAKILFSSEPNLYDMVCYHIQQCVEKFLKAFLAYNKAEIPKTHNIHVLLELCAKIDNTFGELQDSEVGRLTEYAAELRYPGDWDMPDKEETEEALRLMELCVNFVHHRLRKNS
jgi:HEPN domain-containing protein